MWYSKIIMYWANLLHIYQPPNQTKEILLKVVNESYSKILDVLEKRPRVKINLNICASLTELLVKYDFLEIINRIKKLAKKGQIEFVGSVKYHPILPLIPKDEIVRQIELNETLNKKYFGKTWQPKGFFLPELAYEKRVARLIEQLGYQWIVIDEIAYPEPSQLSFNNLYQIKDLNLKVFFRHRQISNLFFTAQAKNIQEFMDFIKSDERLNEGHLITCLDGENIGHHWPGSLALFESILDSNRFETLTLSELADKLKNNIKVVEPRASSWASREDELRKNIPYALWQHPQNPIHQLQWQITNLVIKAVQEAKKDSNYKTARKKLDQALFSCQYWWASAMPWWEPKMIKQGAKELLDSVRALSSSQDLSILEKKYQQLINKVEEWQEIGQAEKIRQAYLNSQDYNQYFGGQILK